MTVYHAVLCLSLAALAESVTATPAMSQRPTRASSRDSLAATAAVASYIKSNYKGLIGFDEGMACKSGRVCDPPKNDAERAREKSDSRIHRALVEGAGGTSIPLKLSVRCQSTRRETCRFIVDHYFQVFQPVLEAQKASFAFYVSGNTPLFGTGNNRIVTTPLRVRLAKVKGTWKVSDVGPKK